MNAVATPVVAPDSGVEKAVLPLRLIDVGLQIEQQPLLSGVSLTLDLPGLTIIIGPNGAGKTMLLRLCHGLIKPTTGEVQWADKNCPKNPRAQAMVFQRPVILRRSVAANIEYALLACGVAKDVHAERITTALELAGLTALATRSARVLSGGEQQRLALARAFAIQPQVLFLDEPTAHLDPGATRNIEQMIHSIQNAGSKIIMTTHDFGQARRLAHDVVFMHRGRMGEHGLAGRFFAQPETTQAAAFLQGELLW